MTRIEVFVDAAFAFALTMLVISFDRIPDTFEEVVLAIKGIPAFVVAVAQLIWIWHTHNSWSRRYGLEDGVTVLLSSALLMVVLVWIYPLRLLAQGAFAWATDGFLPQAINLQSFEQLRFMFVFLGAGFSALCLVFALLYGHALRLAGPLRLDGGERYWTQGDAMVWLSFMAVGLLAVLLALLVPDRLVPLTGFTYTLLAVMGFGTGWWLDHRRPDRMSVGT
jgi:hypothetical protein